MCACACVRVSMCAYVRAYVRVCVFAFMRIFVCVHVCETSYIPKLKEAQPHDYFRNGIACIQNQQFVLIFNLAVKCVYASVRIM